MSYSELRLKLDPLRSKQVLQDLIVQRTLGQHEALFGMKYINAAANGLPYIHHKEGEKDVYRVYIDSDMPLITTSDERKKANFELRRHHWGAGGGFPVLVFNDGSRWVAALYRDAGAPSWPDTYTTPSGLSHYLQGQPERAEITSAREFEEELVFLDKRNLFTGSLDADGKVKLNWNERDLPRTVVDDKKTLIQVYENGSLVEESRPFAVGWGTEKDYVTTVVHAYVIHPELKIPRQEMFLLNGEIVERKQTLEFLSRQVALMNLDDMRNADRSRALVGLVHYKTAFENDSLQVEESERPFEDVKMTEPLAAAIRKVRVMGEKEYRLWFS